MPRTHGIFCPGEQANYKLHLKLDVKVRAGAFLRGGFQGGAKLVCPGWEGGARAAQPGRHGVIRGIYFVDFTLFVLIA